MSGLSHQLESPVWLDYFSPHGALFFSPHGALFFSPHGALFVMLLSFSLTSVISLLHASFPHRFGRYVLLFPAMSTSSIFLTISLFHPNHMAVNLSKRASFLCYGSGIHLCFRQVNNLLASCFIFLSESICLQWSTGQQLIKTVGLVKRAATFVNLI